MPAFSSAPSPSSAGVYKEVLKAQGRGTTAALSGTTYLPVAISSDVSAVAANSTTGPYFSLFQFAAADDAVTGLTTKLFVRAQCPVAAVSLTMTVTVGLYPVTVSAGNYAMGVVVPGSTVVFASPAQNVIAQGNSGDFTIPADGIYAFGYTVSTTPNAAFVVDAQLYNRAV